MRQKYQEKIIDSRAQNEPRKIFDIVNSVGGNSINSTTRTSISILSDTSGTLKIPLKFWLTILKPLRDSRTETDLARDRCEKKYFSNQKRFVKLSRRRRFDKRIDPSSC